MTHSLALYRSYPAAKVLPRVGAFACAESFFTSSGGEAERGGGGAGLPSGDLRAEEDDMLVLGRLGKGEVGRDGGSCDGGGGVVDMVHAKKRTLGTRSRVHYYARNYSNCHVTIDWGNCTERSKTTRLLLRPFCLGC